MSGTKEQSKASSPVEGNDAGRNAKRRFEAENGNIP